MLQEAAQRLQEAVRLLEVEGRGSRLASLQRQLVARRCRLAAAYGAVYAVGPKTGPSTHCMPIPSHDHSTLRCLTTGSVCRLGLHCGPLPSTLWDRCRRSSPSSQHVCGAIDISGTHMTPAACCHQRSDRSGFAVTEPEPPPGGFLWDLMDLLWFTGAALASTRSTTWACMHPSSLTMPSVFLAAFACVQALCMSSASLVAQLVLLVGVRV